MSTRCSRAVARWSTWLGAGMTVVACSSGRVPGAATDTASGKDAGTDAAAAADATADTAPACNVAPTLASLEATYFANSCTFSSCHGTKKQGGLSLLPGKAWASLVNVPAQNPGAGGRLRVVPGDAAGSFLVHKVRGPKPGEGDLMPPGETVPFDEACGIAALEAWIAAGAKPD